MNAAFTGARSRAPSYLHTAANAASSAFRGARNIQHTSARLAENVLHTHIPKVHVNAPHMIPKSGFSFFDFAAKVLAPKEPFLKPAVIHVQNAPNVFQATPIPQATSVPKQDFLYDVYTFAKTKFYQQIWPNLSSEKFNYHGAVKPETIQKLQLLAMGVFAVFVIGSALMALDSYNWSYPTFGNNRDERSVYAVKSESLDTVRESLDPVYESENDTAFHLCKAFAVSGVISGVATLAFGLLAVNLSVAVIGGAFFIASLIGLRIVIERQMIAASSRV